MLRTAVNIAGWTIPIAGAAAFAAFLAQPPLTGFEASAWVYDGQHVSAEVAAWDLKVCRHVKGASTGYAYEGGQWWKVALSIDHDAPPQSAPEWRSLGRWSWDRPEGHADVERVKATLTLICDGKTTPVDVGPFDVRDVRPPHP